MICVFVFRRQPLILNMAPRGVELYRSILKAHRSRLPWDLRQLGNAYVRNEFQLHKKVEKAENLRQFYQAWDDYLKMLLQREERFGQDLRDTDKKFLSDEQHEKLHELKKEAESSSQIVTSQFEQSK